MYSFWPGCHLLVLIVAVGTLPGCRAEAPLPVPPAPDLGLVVPDSATSTASDTLAVDATLPRYYAYPVEGTASVTALKDEIGEDGMAVVMKLNRIDARYARRRDTLIVADALGDWLALSPFPSRVDALRPVPKLLLVSRRVQAFAAYEAGRLVRWGPTSTGKRSTPTPAALYFTNWRMQSRRSTDNPAWLLKWCVNFHNLRGISFHEYAMPGYPASHACVRLMADDARWVYDWATRWILSRDRNTVLAQGTPVIIFGDYAYGKAQPWTLLHRDPQAGLVTPDEIDALLREHGAAVHASQAARYAHLDSLALRAMGIPFY